jgi:hypothetical protein
MLNKSRCQQGVWECGGIASCILNLGEKCVRFLIARSVCFTPVGRRPSIHWMGDLVGPSSGPEVVAKKPMRASTSAFKLFGLFTAFITELP